MSALATTILGKALLALLPAGAAWLAARRGRRRLAHPLWVLALLVLLAPPLWTIGVLPAPVGRAPAASQPAEVRVGPAPAAPPRAPALAPADVLSAPSAARTAHAPAPPPTRAGAGWGWLLALAAAGSGLLGLVLLRRLLRLRAVLAGAGEAPAEVVARLDALAGRLGIRRPPRLRFAPGIFPPLLVALGTRTTMLLPLELWRRLDEDERDTLLAHELAHHARRDPWVRWIETIARVLWWWHPIVWCAGPALHRLEEEACDAWVVRLLPRRRKAYARTLLRTLDFLTRDRLPALGPACAFAPLDHTRRRLAMIDAATPHAAPALGRPARLALLALALLLAPLAPVRADDAEDEGAEEGPVIVTEAEAGEDAPEAVPVPLEEAAGEDAAPEDVLLADTRLLTVSEDGLAAVLQAALEQPTSTEGPGAWVLDGAARDRLLGLVGRGGLRALTAPRLALLAGQRGNVQIVNQQSYVADFEVTEEADGGRIVDPVIEVLNTGFSIDLTLTPRAGTDRTQVLVDAERRELASMEAEVFWIDGHTVTTQRPVVHRVGVESALSLPAGRAALIVGPGYEGEVMLLLLDVRRP